MLEHLKWWWGWCWWQCISNVKGSLLLVADDEDGNYVDIDDDIYLNNAVMIIKADDAFKTRCGNPGLRWMCLGRSLQTMVVAISTGSVPGSSLTLFLIFTAIILQWWWWWSTTTNPAPPRWLKIASRRLPSPSPASRFECFNQNQSLSSSSSLSALQLWSWIKYDNFFHPQSFLWEDGTQVNKRNNNRKRAPTSSTQTS